MTSSTRRTRRWTGLTAAGTALALASACGSGSSGTSTSPVGAGAGASASAHNAADVSFATEMIPHHAQAVEMAGLALSNGADAEIKSLAAAIKGAQDPEIATMSGWLKAWGSPVPSTGGMAGMGGMGGTSSTMMSAAEMKALAAVKGAAFDRMWVEMMTRHHQGAIEMAKAELAKGQDPQAKALATAIIKAQTAEIATMAKIKARIG